MTRRLLRLGLLPAAFLAAVATGAGTPAPRAVQDDAALAATAVYQGAQSSDAFSAIHHVGFGRIIAGKRTSSASNRFLLSLDSGATWSVVPCPGSTGAHTYFFGQNNTTLLAGTGDTGSACVMRSGNKGTTWSVVLSAGQLNSLTGSANTRSVFGLVHLGAGRWLANVKTLDTTVKVILSTDDGLTWSVPPAQPGQGASSWARQMIMTGDGVLLWPSVLTDKMYRSTDMGVSWQASTVQGAKLFQPLCDAGQGIYICGEVTLTPNAPIRLFRSPDRGVTWLSVATVNLQRSTLTYWRDVTRAGDVLYASACCTEGTSNDRNMQLFRSADTGKTWSSLGNPYIGPFGGMQAIYQMCAIGSGEVFAACQPDSTILRWSVW